MLKRNSSRARMTYYILTKEMLYQRVLAASVATESTVRSFASTKLDSHSIGLWSSYWMLYQHSLVCTPIASLDWSSNTAVSKPSLISRVFVRQGESKVGKQWPVLLHQGESSFTGQWLILVKRISTDCQILAVFPFRCEYPNISLQHTWMNSEFQWFIKKM